MKCPDCGIEIVILPCERCANEAARHEQEMQNLIEEFSLVRGAPDTHESRISLDFALERIQERLDKEQFKGTVSYNNRDLLRSQRWYYIPYVWVGCRGFIVDLESGYVNWLGSALSLKDCVWGHEHGIVFDLVDFTFAADTPRELAARLLERFRRMVPGAPGASPKGPAWYRDSEIPAAMVNHFPIFRRHFAWYAIPELFKACESEGLRFTCSD